MKLSAYLNFDGHAEDAINYYCDLFGAKTESLMRFSDAPAEMAFPKEIDHKIMHCTLHFADCTFHISDSMQEQIALGNSVHLSLATETAEEAHAIFAGLSVGGSVTMAMADVFWGGIFGMVTDRFGIQWMISAPKNP